MNKHIVHTKYNKREYFLQTLLVMHHKKYVLSLEDIVESR